MTAFSINISEEAETRYIALVLAVAAKDEEMARLLFDFNRETLYVRNNLAFHLALVNDLRGLAEYFVKHSTIDIIGNILQFQSNASLLQKLSQSPILFAAQNYQQAKGNQNLIHAFYYGIMRLNDFEKADMLEGLIRKANNPDFLNYLDAGNNWLIHWDAALETATINGYAHLANFIVTKKLGPQTLSGRIQRLINRTISNNHPETLKVLLSYKRGVLHLNALDNERFRLAIHKMNTANNPDERQLAQETVRILAKYGNIDMNAASDYSAQDQQMMSDWLRTFRV